MDDGSPPLQPSYPGLCVTLGSFMVGLIPFAYALTFGQTQSHPTTITTGEAGLWSVFGEKKDTSSGVPK